MLITQKVWGIDMATRRTHRETWPGRSEFAGEVRSNTLPMKEVGAPLSPSERVRLIYLTGTEDIQAEPDRRAWLGWNAYPDSVIDFEDR